MKKLLFLLVLPVLLFSCKSKSDKEDLTDVKPVKIEFYEAYSTMEMRPLLDTIVKWSSKNDSLIKSHHISKTDLSSLISVVSMNSGVIALVQPRNMESVKAILALDDVKKMLPKGMSFVFSVKPMKTYSRTATYELYALKIPENGRAKVNGSHVKDAEKSLDINTSKPVIVLTMTDEGQQIWYDMTSQNIGKYIAIVLDGKVISCPNVINTIDGGPTEISGNFTVEEAEDLARGIRAGR